MAEGEVRSESPLVGRHGVLRLLGDAIEAATQGRGSLVLITGDPGIGKTAVAAEAAARAKKAGARVLWASCWEGEGVPGFWPWLQVLRPILPPVSPGDDATPTVRRLLLERGSGGSDSGARSESALDLRFKLFEEVSAVLESEGRSRPVLMVLDDLQWADVPSIQLLGFLARRLPMLRLLVVGTCRDVEVSAGSSLASLLAGGAASAVLPLGDLSRSDVANLIERILGRDPGEALTEAVQRRTGGNPFFVQQVSRLLAAQSESSQPLQAVTVPLGVEEAVRRRLARLHPGCVQLLEAGAVLGPAWTLRTVAAVGGQVVEEAAPLLAEAVHARVLVGPPDPLGRYTFAHDLFRECLYEGLGPEACARLHLQAGRTLAAERETGRSIELAELANHFMLGAEAGGQEEALRYSRLAAEEATGRLAYEEAARHRERVLQVMESQPRADPGALGRGLVELGLAHQQSGAMAAATRAFTRAVESARRAGDRVALARAALGLHAIGIATWAPHDQLVGLLREAAEGLDESEHRVLLARTLAARARELAWFGLDVELARSLSARAVEVARRSGDSGTLAYCLVARHNVVWGPGNAEERLELAEEVLRLAHAGGDLQLVAEARVLKLSDLLELADPAMHAELDELALAATALRQPRVRYAVLTRRAMRAQLTGPIAEAERLVEEAAELGREIDEPDATNVRFAQLGEIRAAQGRQAEILGEMGRWLEENDLGPTELVIRSNALLEQGDREAALSMVAPLLEADPGEIPEDRMWLYVMTVAADLSVRLGLERHAELGLRLLAPYAGLMVTTGAAITCVGSVDHYLGTLAAALGKRGEALTHHERALRLHERLGARVWELRSRYEVARLRLTEPGGGGSLEELERVAAAAARLGLSALEGLARRTLEETRFPESGVFRRHGSSWTLGYGGLTVQMPDAKGLRDLATLLRSPGKAVAAVELVAGDAGEEVRAGLWMGADRALDERARREYRDRLAELDREIAAAEGWADVERAARAREERDALLEQLAAAAGLGGRARRLGDQSERARKTVTARIRHVLDRLDSRHPAMARHIRASITTGTFCSYSPSSPTSWEL